MVYNTNTCSSKTQCHQVCLSNFVSSSGKLPKKFEFSNSRTKIIQSTFNRVFDEGIPFFTMDACAITSQKNGESNNDVGGIWNAQRPPIDDVIIFLDKLEEMWNTFNSYLNSCQNGGCTSTLENVNPFMTAYHIWDIWLSLKDLDFKRCKYMFSKKSGTHLYTLDLFFLKLVDYVSRFVKNFNLIAKPMTKVTSKDQ